LNSLYPSLVDLEYLSKYAAHRSLKLQTPRRLIEAIDNQPEPDARPPPTKLRPFVIRSPTPSQTKTATVPRPILGKPLPGRTVSITSSIMKPVTPLTTTVRPTIVKTAIQPLTVSSGVITGITQSQLTSLVAQSGAQIVRTTSATTTAGKQYSSNENVKTMTCQIVDDQLMSSVPKSWDMKPSGFSTLTLPLALSGLLTPYISPFLCVESLMEYIRIWICLHCRRSSHITATDPADTANPSRYSADDSFNAASTAPRYAGQPSWWWGGLH